MEKRVPADEPRAQVREASRGRHQKREHGEKGNVEGLKPPGVDDDAQALHVDPEREPIKHLPHRAQDRGGNGARREQDLLPHPAAAEPRRIRARICE
jgi:hypothetical protein